MFDTDPGVVLPHSFTDFLRPVYARGFGETWTQRAAALIILPAIILGSTVNIPIKRLPRGEEIVSDRFVMFGLDWFVHLPRIRRSHVTIAVNVGGCIIPSTLAIYEGLLVAQHESRALVELIIVTALGRRTVQRSGPRIERIGGQTMFL